MKIFKPFLITMMIAFSYTMDAQTKEIEDVSFATAMSINYQNTVLNGGGLREKYGFLDLYVGALYVQANTNDANKVIMADEEMGIRIVIVSSMVTRERFIEALEDGFKNTTAGKSSPQDVANFKKYLSDEFVEGDEILLNYHAGDAVYLYKNGKERGKFSGLPFKQALFGIWLGGNPADDSLKEDMLGL